MLSHHHSLARLVLFQLVVCAFWVAATPAIAWLAEAFPLLPPRPGPLLVHLGTGGVLGLLHLAWSIAVMIVMRPYDEMTISRFPGPFLELLRGKLTVEMLTYWGILGAVFSFSLYERSRERALRAAELERELARARLQALSLQLQPHFLFNALHSVAGLVRAGEPQAAITTIATLSELLRYALDSTALPR